MPTPKLSHISPSEKLYHQKPDYNFLKVLGCLCYTWLRPYSSHKIQPRSTLCVFIGYHSSAKGYRCLDTSTGQVYLSRHVKFDENVFLFASFSPSSPPSLTQLQQFFWHPARTSANTFHNSPTIPNSPIPPLVSFPPICSSAPISTSPTSSLHIPIPNSPVSSLQPSPFLDTALQTSPTSLQHTTTDTQTSSLTPSSSTTSSNVHNILTRSKHGIFKPKHPLCLSTIAPPISSSSISEPKCYKEALLSPEWSAAMLE